MPARASNDASPVKTIDRAATILRCLAQGPQEGSRLSDIASRSGLGKTTTHRLLAALVSVGFVDRGESRLYRLGYALFSLGASARRFDLANLVRPSLLRLAAETEDTIFLSIRDGDEALCLDRCTGNFPIRTLTLNVGDRRPLGVGAGSLAILAFLEEEERERVIASNEAARTNYPNFSSEKLKELVAETRRRGFAFNDGRIVSAMAAIAVPILDPEGSVVAALSIAAIRERMQPDRIARLVESLQREAEDVGVLLRTRERSRRSKQV